MIEASNVALPLKNDPYCAELEHFLRKIQSSISTETTIDLANIPKEDENRSTLYRIAFEPTFKENIILSFYRIIKNKTIWGVTLFLTILNVFKYGMSTLIYIGAAILLGCISLYIGTKIRYEKIRIQEYLIYMLMK